MPADQNLASILTSWRLEARSAFGHAMSALERDGVDTGTQNCVCFTETPLELIHLLIGEIENRAFHFEPFGVAITKKVGRTLGINPVWYLDITPGHDWLSSEVNTLVRAAVDSGNFATSPISRLTPFMEQMGSGTRQGGGGGYRKEFWWEREWRCVGDLVLPSRVLVICPENRFEDFRRVIETLDIRVGASFIDPAWGLEQIIARLAGFSREEVDLL